MMMGNLSDTLVVDTARLAAWRQEDDYAYDRELVPNQKSVMEWIGDQINEFFDTIFGSDFYEVNASTIWIVIAVISLLAIGTFLLKRHPELFMRSGKGKQVEYEVTDDNIYGVDFNTEINKAMERKDYREVLRLVYLQTLRLLSDNHLLNWQPFKTPTQYTLEWKNADFQLMTRLFIRVRYGKFEASQEMVAQMFGYQKQVSYVISHEEKGGGQ